MNFTPSNLKNLKYADTDITASMDQFHKTFLLFYVNLLHLSKNIFEYADTNMAFFYG
jgi:hypothetical protein